MKRFAASWLWVAALALALVCAPLASADMTSSLVQNGTASASASVAKKNGTSTAGAKNATGSATTSNSTEPAHPVLANSTGPDAGAYLTVGFRYAKGDNRSRVFSAENATTSDISFMYTTQDKKKKMGVLTTPGDHVVFEVPHKFRKWTTLSRVWLLHRKPKEGKGTMAHISKIAGPPAFTWDMQPTWHALSCRDSVTKKWHEWAGPRYFTRIGEPRTYDDPKIDNRRFAEAREKGDPLHDHVDDFHRWMGKYACDMIRVSNVSPVESKGALGAIHGIRVEYRPLNRLDDSIEDEAVFTPNTIFADPPGRPETHFGGGREVTQQSIHFSKTIYPGAKVLTEVKDKKKMPPIDRIAPWLAIKEGGLIIRLRADKPFAQCIVAMGNTKFDASKNISTQLSRDHWVGLPGKTSIFASLRVGNDTHVEFPHAYQIDGAQMVRLDAEKALQVPKSSQKTWIYDGAFFRVDIKGDPVHIMGVKCQYYAKPYPTVKEQQGGQKTNRTSKVISSATANSNTTSNANSTHASKNATSSSSSSSSSATKPSKVTKPSAGTTTAKNATAALSFGKELSQDITHDVAKVEKEVSHVFKKLTTKLLRSHSNRKPVRRH